jgi:hypothetical protein
LERHTRVVPEGGDKVLTVDGAELDVFQARGGNLFTSSFETDAQGPPVVSVYAYVNHAAFL